jgi:SAM-dependent methyltransferase
MHHLAADLKSRGLKEIHRVLKRDGRLVLADFDYADNHGQLEQPAKNGFGGTADLSQLLQAAGFAIRSDEHIRLPKQHRGWSGITVTAAIKSDLIGQRR